MARPACDGGAHPAVGWTASRPEWRLVIETDRNYFAETDSWALPGAVRIPFPDDVAPRSVALHGSQLLIGRRSPELGATPDIDLSGDPKVSPAHALLVADFDGGWSLVDLRSTHGTYLNDAINPIGSVLAVRLHNGDQFHIGAWTTLTMRKT